MQDKVDVLRESVFNLYELGVHFSGTSKVHSDSVGHKGNIDVTSLNVQLMVSASVLVCFYFLLVVSLSSDGPYDDKIQVSPLQFVTNWTQSFTMTCLATDVYPLPSYVWDDITCDNDKGSTCTFTPPSPGNITTATCIVKRQRFDGFGNKLASKSVRLDFKCKYKVSLK